MDEPPRPLPAWQLVAACLIGCLLALALLVFMESCQESVNNSGEYACCT